MSQFQLKSDIPPSFIAGPGHPDLRKRAAHFASLCQERDKPWLALGLSRATYFRRKAAGELSDAFRTVGPGSAPSS